MPDPGADVWGLHAFEDPAKGAAEARPVWRADASALVLDARAGPGGAAADCFDLDAVRAYATVIADPDDAAHLLISDGLRAIRLDVTGADLWQGPVALRYALSGFSSAEAPLLVLRRVLSFWRHRRFSSPLHPAEPRARRWVLMLRVRDARDAGATQREIATHLFDREASEPRWRSEVPSVRSQVQRLVRTVNGMEADHYRGFLS